MTVKLSGSLPQEHDRNGMERLHAQLVKHPDRRHVIVMIVDCVRTTIEHTGDGERYTPTAGALFVEPITDEADVDTIVDIMGRVRADRIGDATLDFDFGVGTDPMAKAAFDLRTASGVYVADDEDAS
ncbi:MULTISPECIES: hypothetical protein [Bacteria]|uniref:Uncharacterized protein n=1 Tax=Microbacterium phage Min1 TaxID=446529 RepID=A6N1X1_9CAUD|nr:hypothetical protein MPMin1_gp13 [Microbacterium phage Min1]ABR10443.1 hypothetical protein [Microbacterium phage Min1]